MQTAMSSSDLDGPTKQLIRIQLLSPLSTLVSLGVNLGAATLFKPSLGDISSVIDPSAPLSGHIRLMRSHNFLDNDYLTIFTPNKTLIGIYWVVLFLLQIGYALLLVFFRRDVTKSTVVHAVGFRFPLANLAMALWGVLWSLRMFFAAEICLAVAFVMMGTVYLSLLFHPSSIKRPFDLFFIHAMCRLFFLILLTVDIWQGVLLALRWYKYVGDEPLGPDRPGKWEGEHSKHSWIAMAVVLTVGMINAFIVFIGKDFIWALGSIYLYVALIIKGPKPAQVFIPLILMAALQVIALLAAIIQAWVTRGKEGAVRLPDEEDASPAPAPEQSGNDGSNQISQGSREGPREVEDL